MKTAAIDSQVFETTVEHARALTNLLLMASNSMEDMQASAISMAAEEIRADLDRLLDMEQSHHDVPR